MNLGLDFIISWTKLVDLEFYNFHFITLWSLIVTEWYFSANNQNLVYIKLSHQIHTESLYKY